MKSNKVLMDPHNFDPEIITIEQEVVRFFTEKASEFVGRHPHVSTIMILFYTRKKLTQKDLQTLTGLSAGSISKALQQLVKMNFISRSTIPGTHTNIYMMEKVPFVSTRFFLATGRFLGDVEKELKGMKEILDANSKEMKELEGYNRIYDTITQILKLMPLTEVFMTMLEEELKS